MRKLAAVFLTAVFSISALTACGSSASEAGDKADGTENVAEQAVPEANALEDESIAFMGSQALADGVLSVGTNAEFPPFEYIDDSGKPDGFDIALIKAIGETIGVEVQVNNMEFASLLSSIGTKNDVSIAGMTVTEERKLEVDFSNPYYTAVQYVLLPKTSDIAAADDLKGKVIGVQIGTTGDFLAEKIADANVSQYNRAGDAVSDLVSGRLDCVIVDKNPALVFESKYEGQIQAVDGVQFGFESEEYAIAMLKGDAALAEQINNALEQLKADGTFDALVAEYIEEAAEEGTEESTGEGTDENTGDDAQGDADKGTGEDTDEGVDKDTGEDTDKGADN